MKKILTFIDPYTIGFLSILTIIFINLGYFVWDYNILIPFIVTAIIIFVVPYIVIYGIKLGGMLVANHDKNNISYFVGENTTDVEKVNIVPVQVDAIKTIKNKERSSIFKVSNGIRVYINKQGEIKHTFGIGFLITIITKSGELSKDKIIKLNYKPFLNLFLKK